MSAYKANSSHADMELPLGVTLFPVDDVIDCDPDVNLASIHYSIEPSMDLDIIKKLFEYFMPDQYSFGTISSMMNYFSKNRYINRNKNRYSKDLGNLSVRINLYTLERFMAEKLKVYINPSYEMKSNGKFKFSFYLHDSKDLISISNGYCNNPKDERSTESEMLKAMWLLLKTYK